MSSLAACDSEILVPMLPPLFEFTDFVDSAFGQVRCIRREHAELTRSLGKSDITRRTGASRRSTSPANSSRSARTASQYLGRSRLSEVSKCRCFVDGVAPARKHPSWRPGRRDSVRRELDRLALPPSSSKSLQRAMASRRGRTVIERGRNLTEAGRPASPAPAIVNEGVLGRRAPSRLPPAECRLERRRRAARCGPCAVGAGLLEPGVARSWRFGVALRPFPPGQGRS